MAAITVVDTNTVGTIFPGGVSVHAGVYSITDGDTLTLGSAVQAVVATDAQNTTAATILPIGARIGSGANDNQITFNHNDGGAASCQVVVYFYK
jgi:hypothetical protein